MSAVVAASAVAFSSGGHDPMSSATTAESMEAVPLRTDCILSFHRLSAECPDGKVLLHDLSGYVRQGGITAVLGRGGSGKSLLLRLLCSREPLLTSSGSIVCEGRNLSLGNSSSCLGFVGQEDVGLVGELTPREVITFNARLGSAARSSAEEQRRIVDDVIRGLGLEAVADNAIGTVLKRGLSGGEKRRVSVGAVLASRPAVICLDEPTSGLDAAVAYTVIQSVKALAQSNNIGILLTIHQPSARILTLFDDLILLDAGQVVFVGPTSLSTHHFEALGFPCPPISTPTDHFLDVVRHGQGAPAVFVQGYRQGLLKSTIQQRLQLLNDVGHPTPEAPAVRAPAWRQVQLLCHRNVLIASRDVSLYWLQLVLAVGFAFLTGAVFWSLPRTIGSRLQDQSNAIVWLTFIASYLQVFKIYYLYLMKNRVHDEHANGLYSVLAWSVSSFATTAFFVFIVYVPALLVGYGMMGLPNSAIGYMILSLFLTAMTAEALLELLLQFTSHLPTAILLGQGALVILCVYAGGAFIRWSSLGFWVWLSDLSLYTFSTRGMMIVVYRDMVYTCPPSLIAGSDQCPFNGISYPCQSGLNDDGSCNVAGSTVLQLYQRVSQTDEWFQLGMLVVLFASFRVLTHLFLMIPPGELFHRLWHRILRKARSESAESSSSCALPSPGAPVETVIQVGIAPAPIAPVKPATQREYGLTFQDVCLRLGSKTGPLLVDHVSGSARSGRVLAVMGPSGAGKTTFLNAVSGRAPYAIITGAVQLEGEPLAMQHLSYVPQFDCLNPAFTVNQTFCMTALLQHRGLKDCATTVHELLDILNLTDKRHASVSSLSSGERKRIAIGLGLLGQPRVLLLDEPTTGLDSTTSAMIVDYIIRVTRRTNVICLLTIHQPSAQLFSSLDDLLLLSNGRMAFFGPLTDVSSYFDGLGFNPLPGSNPADLYLDLMNAKPDELHRLRNSTASAASSRDSGEAKIDWSSEFVKWHGERRRAPMALTDSIIPSSDEASVHPKELRRLWILTTSRAVYFWQERVLYLYRLVELICIAIFVGTLFLRLPTNVESIGEIGGALFFKVWVILFVAISGTPVMVRDRLVFENEYLNQTFRAGTYLLANFLAVLPYQLISAIIYEAILWYLVGFNNGISHWVFSVASTFSLLLMMESISLITVQVLKDAMLATTFSMVVLGTLFLFPGFFVSTSNMVASIRWASYVVPTHYDLDSQMANVFRGQEYDAGDGSTVSGDTILQQYFSIDESYDKWLDWFIVMMYTVGFRFMHWLLVLFQYRKYGHS